MPLDLLVVPRRQIPVLAAVLSSETRKGKTYLELLAEDGARFHFPAEQALARVEVASDDTDPAASLRAIRARVEPHTEWLALRAKLADGAELTFEQAAAAAGCAGTEGVLRLALGIESAAPWFRRKGRALQAVPMQEALRRLLEMRLREFEEAGDRELIAWWPDRAAGPPLAWGGVHDAREIRARVLADRARFVEPGYAPNAAAAGADALRALADWAIAGDVDETARGKDLARRLGLPEGPDVALEELVASAVIPPDVDPAPVRAGLARPFPEDALAEAAGESVDVPREDLTAVFTVAIDDASTREVDDALSLREVDGDCELLVHVADVAAAVPCGGALDAALRERASSLYLPDRQVYMLPAELATERLTLALGEPRPAVTAFLRIDAAGDLVSARFARTWVTLDRRATYAETRDTDVLGADPAAGARLAALGELLRAARVRRGARVTDLPSLRVDVVDGAPRLGLRIQDTPGDRIVSEAMVLCNTAAGGLLASKAVPALFRRQDAGVPAGRSLPEPDDPLHDLLVRRTFQPVSTGAEAGPHAGLGANAYAQCTSPLRRYGDLVNQRQVIAAGTVSPAPHSVVEIEDMIPRLQERERAVRSAGDARTAVFVARAIAAEGRTTVRGRLSRAPRHGHGAVWVPELCRDLPLDVPRGWRTPPLGTEREWSIAAIHPWRGRIELAPTEE